MRLHHFTSPYNASAILVGGLIRRTDSVFVPGPATVETTGGNPPREVVHLTRDPDPANQLWSKNMLVTGEPVNGGWIEGELDKRRIRWTVSETAVEPWIDAARRLGTPQWWIDNLGRSGGDTALMPNYYVCPRDIPRRKWRLVEDTATGEILWRRPMLHEYPERWRESMPFYFDFSLGREEMERLLIAYYDEGNLNPALAAAFPDEAARFRGYGEPDVVRRTIDSWFDDYAVERTEEEWVEHLRTFDEYGDSPGNRGGRGVRIDHDGWIANAGGAK